jgi:hypothetical protein
MLFAYVNENRTVKPVKILLRKQVGDMRENDGGGKIN